ncbi:MAG: ATP-binding protein [Myxococcota bacterium]
MKLKKKILLGYNSVFFLLGIVFVWAIANLVSLGSSSKAILSENYRSILAAENMVDALERQDSGILLIFLGDAEKGYKQFQKNDANFIEWLARAKDNVTIEGEKKLIEDIDSKYKIYRHKFSTWIDFNEVDNYSLVSSVYSVFFFPSFNKIRKRCIELRRLNEITMFNASVKTSEVANRAIWSTSVLAILSFILAIIFSFILSEKIVRPLRNFMEAAQKISGGNYEVEVKVNTKDELGQLASNFNEMSKKLSTYHQINIEQLIYEKNKGAAILSNIEDGLVVFDDNLKATNINPAGHKILGLSYTDTESLHCQDIFSYSKVCKQLKETIDKGKHPDVPAEKRIISLSVDNKVRQYMFSISVIHGSNKNFDGIVLLLRDVTRMKEIENMKNEFVIVASHELRTPLTSMGMCIDLLMESILDMIPEKDKKLLKAAHEETHRMKALINDLLDLSKIEAGQIEMQFNKVKVDTLTKHVKKVFKHQFETKSIKISTDIPEDLPEVKVDANKITWVLTNLISNAMRYVGEDGHITLKALKIGSSVHMSVQDNGPGIPQEYQSKIFQKFVQVEGQETKGTGLGLAICKEIVRAHGGAIWVESTEGEGSTFTFTLPLFKKTRPALNI